MGEDKDNRDDDKLPSPRTKRDLQQRYRRFGKTSRSAKKIKIKPHHRRFKTKSKRSKAINKRLTAREIIEKYVKLRYGDLDKKTRDRKIRELYFYMFHAGIKSDQLVLEIPEIVKKRS